MTQKQNNTETAALQKVLLDCSDFLRQHVESILQEILQTDFDLLSTQPVMNATNRAEVFATALMCVLYRHV